MVYLGITSMLSLLRARVQSLVKELISHEPFGVAKKKKKKEGMRRVRLSEKLAETMDVEVLGGLKNQIQIWILEKMKWHWSEKCLKMSHRKGSDEV